MTRITRHSQRRVLTGLPSVAEEGGVAASGPVDLGFSGWTGYCWSQPGRRRRHP